MSQFLANTISGPLNSARESITVSDCSAPDLPLVYVNKGFQDISGYRPDEVIGKNCRFLQGALHEQNGVIEMRLAPKEGKGRIVELVNFRKDGSCFINRLSITPIFDHSGKPKYYTGVQHDVTDLKNIEEKLRSFLMQTLSRKTA